MHPMTGSFVLEPKESLIPIYATVEVKVFNPYSDMPGLAVEFLSTIPAGCSGRSFVMKDLQIR